MTSANPDFAFHTSVRTANGRVLVHVTQAALDKMRTDPADSDMAVLSAHLPRLQAVALQLAARSPGPNVTVDAADVWWTARGEGPEATQAA